MSNFFILKNAYKKEYFKEDYTERNVYNLIRPTPNGLFTTDLIIGGDCKVNKKLFVMEDMDVSGTINIHGIVDLSGFGGKINDTIIGYDKPNLGSFTDLSAQVIIATNKVKAPLLEVETINYNYQNVTVNDTDMDISGNLDVSNNLDVSGATTLHSTLDVIGDTSVTTFDSTGATSLATSGGNVNIASSGAMTSVEGTLNVSELVTLNNNLTVAGLSTFNAGVDMSGAIDLSGGPGAVTLDVSGVTTLHSRLDVIGDTNVNTFDSIGATSLATNGGAVNIASTGIITTVKGLLNVLEPVTFDDTLIVNGLSTFNTGVDMSGAIDLSGGSGAVTLDVSGVTTLHSRLDVIGDTSVNTFDSIGATTLASNNGPVNIASAGAMTTLKGTLKVHEAVTLDSTLAVTGPTILGMTDISGSDLSNSKLDVSGATILHSTLDVTGRSTLPIVDISSGTIDGVAIGINNVCTDLRVDNLKIDENTISSTNANGDIYITPDGSGRVLVPTMLAATAINLGGTDVTASASDINVLDYDVAKPTSASNSNSNAQNNNRTINHTLTLHAQLDIGNTFTFQLNNNLIKSHSIVLASSGSMAYVIAHTITNGSCKIDFTNKSTQAFASSSTHIINIIVF